MSTDIDTEFRVQVLLSIQQALLGLVTPDLRAVAARIHPGSVEGQFIYGGPVTELQEETVEEFETLVLADLKPPVSVNFAAVAAPPPAELDFAGGATYCYLRRED